MTSASNLNDVAERSEAKIRATNTINQTQAPVPMTLRSAIMEHWPEYFMEGALLGILMIVVGLSVTFFGSPRSPGYALIPNSNLRLILMSLAVGLTDVFLIHSRWGKRSGAHMNPAITLAFLRLNKIRSADALFYILAQTLGGTLGILIVVFLARSLFTDPPVQYAATLPGPMGDAAAFIGETVISFLLMTTILAFTRSQKLIGFTDIAVGCLVVTFIILEAPLSGTSMNPARTIASYLPGLRFQHLWIYILGPTLGMVGAAELRLRIDARRSSGCAKLLHPAEVRCIHCGYVPSQQPGAM